MKQSLMLARGGVIAIVLVIPLGSAPATGQARYFWSTKYDGGIGRDDFATDVAISPQGRIFVAGSSENASNTDALVQAYDAYGSLAWEKRIDFGGYEAASKLAFDSLTGDLYVVGTSSSGGVMHWLILRMSAQTGAIVWQQDYSGPQVQYAFPFSMTLPAGGGVVVGGFLGTYPSQSCVARFDAAGALIWDWIQSVSGVTSVFCEEVAADPGGDIAARISASNTGTNWTIHRLSSTGVLRWSTPIGSASFGASGPQFDSASNVVFAVNPANPVIGKLDSAGSLLWSKSASTFFLGDLVFSVAVAPGDDVVAASKGGAVARLDPAGNLMWVRTPPPVGWFEQTGIASGLAIAPSGDVIVRLIPSPSVVLNHFDALLRWDAGGNFLWSQSVRDFDPSVAVRTSGLKLAPQGSVVLAGSTRAGPAPQDFFVAAVRESSHLGCYGDGSSGPCPCGNTVSPGVVSGCLNGQSNLLGARLDDQGIASVGSDSLSFGADHLAPSGIAILLQGTPSTTTFNFQDGRMCMQGPLRRIYAVAFSGATVDLAPPGGQRVHERSAALGDPIQPGTSRTYQLFYRSAQSACVQGQGNLTNSVVVDWSP
jgi:hypothetical protein